ncbi:MAG: retron St85 family effector protein [Pyrinomonadaceae bacterium]
MSWLKHPRYEPAVQRLVTYLKADKYRFKSLKPLVFLCGGRGPGPRDQIYAYLRKYWPDLHVFYAEKVWDVIASQGHLNALQMEETLAEMADMLVIIVESPGTFAELGAFSLSEPLRTKLLPILDIQFEGDDSFINTGPVKWIQA